MQEQFFKNWEDEKCEIYDEADHFAFQGSNLDVRGLQELSLDEFRKGLIITLMKSLIVRTSSGRSISILELSWNIDDEYSRTWVAT